MNRIIQLTIMTVSVSLLSGCAESPYNGNAYPSQAYRSSSPSERALYQGQELPPLVGSSNGTPYQGGELPQEASLYKGQGL
jgi:hypothetical protein